MFLTDLGATPSCTSPVQSVCNISENSLPQWHACQIQIKTDTGIPLFHSSVFPNLSLKS